MRHSRLIHGCFRRCNMHRHKCVEFVDGRPTISGTDRILERLPSGMRYMWSRTSDMAASTRCGSFESGGCAETPSIGGENGAGGGDGGPKTYFMGVVLHARGRNA